MNYRSIGKSGLKVSEIALGAWLTYGGTVEAKQAESIINTAIDNGINFFDLADGYSGGKAEEVVGHAFKNHLRSDLVISSKVFFPMSENINDRGLSRKHIMESVEKSLNRIGTDYIDVYFCHRYDPETEVEETVRAMDDLIRQGKILYWGISDWSAAQIERAIDEASFYKAYFPIANQPGYNMLFRRIEPEIMPVCAKNGIGLTVYSPLAQGLLTGKYNDSTPSDSRGATTSWLEHSLTPDNIDKVIKLSDIAKSLDITLSQLALAWILNHPEVSCAIIGATQVEHVQENAVAADIELRSETLAAIDEIIG
jgi:voltage-dependent potassium channel beta subunit